ncbi:MAG: transporter [Saprospiraceae bacterium]|nr:transporter [Saprospiraceae bacterium]
MKVRYIRLLFVFAIVSTLPSLVAAQGCVAVRPMGCGGSNPTGNSFLMNKGDVQAGILYRYFESYKHFRGDSEEEERVENGTEVINDAHSLDISLTYALSHRLSLTANLPLIYYDRSSLYEHYGNSLTANPEQKRFHTGAQGIGDMRFSASYWMLNPEKHMKTNFALGLGVKLPTGNENVQDEFHKRKASDGTDTVIIKAVDQSIQLGDGGVGISIDLQAYTVLSNRFSLYLNGFYMSNPRETNNTVNRILTASSTISDSITQFHSVADQFAFRFGANFVVLPKQGLVFGLGVRAEGVPAKDLVGGSWGFRRPGYIISAEPGLSYQAGNLSLNLSVPVALYRNRVKSVSDLADPAGLRHGDAAFADYLVNFGATYRFAKHHQMMEPKPVFKDAN